MPRAVVRDAQRAAAAAMRPNLLDRAIAAVAPEYGLRRLVARGRWNMASGGWDAGRSGGREQELRNLRAPLGDADANNEPDLDLMRRRSRHAGRNNPVASGVLGRARTSVVGTGIVPRPNIDHEYLGLREEEASAWERDALRVVRHAMLDARWDAKGRADAIAQQAMVLRAAMDTGDILAIRRWKPTNGRTFATCIELVEGDRVSNPHDMPDTDRMRQGVELDAHGEPIAYHVRSAHPSTVRLGAMNAWTWARVPIYGAGTSMRQAILCYRVDRPEQSRGVPEIAPILAALHQLGEYSNAELRAAVVSAFFTVFVKSESGEELPQGLTAPGDTKDTPDPVAARAQELAMGPAAILALDPGEDIVIADPKRPNANFGPFADQILTLVGAAIGMPLEVMQQRYQSSYSAAKAAILEWWRRVLEWRMWLVRTFCQPTYEWLLAEAVARGVLLAPGFFDDPFARAAWSGCIWTGPTRGTLDEVKEVEAATRRVAGGFSTMESESLQLTGSTWSEKVPTIRRERALLQDLGITAAPVDAPSTESALAAGDDPAGHPDAPVDAAALTGARA